MFSFLRWLKLGMFDLNSEVSGKRIRHMKFRSPHDFYGGLLDSLLTRCAVIGNWVESFCMEGKVWYFPIAIRLRTLQGFMLGSPCLQNKTLINFLQQACFRKTRGTYSCCCSPMKHALSLSFCGAHWRPHPVIREVHPGSVEFVVVDNW